MTFARLTIVFSLALVFFLVQGVPMAVFLALADPARLGIGWRSVEGTVWQGIVHDIHAGGVPLGDLDAALRPLPIALGRLAVDWRLSGPGIAANGTVEHAVTGDVAVTDTSFRLGLRRMPLLVPLEGDLETDIRRLAFDRAGCRDVDATVVTDALRASAERLDWQGPVLRGQAFCDAGTLVLPLRGSGDGTDVAVTAALEGSGAYRLRFALETADERLARFVSAVGFEHRNGRFELLQRGRWTATGARAAREMM